MSKHDRSASVRLLWAAVRKIPDGEEAMRAAVARINERDGTNTAVRGMREYTSTKLLSAPQLFEIADELRKKAGLPPPQMRPQGPRGGRPRRPESGAGQVSYLASSAERHYVDYLFDLIRAAGGGFESREARDRFLARQTKGSGLTTHAALNAVVAPLERILRDRGYVCRTMGRSKSWEKIGAVPFEGACCAKAQRIKCICRFAFTCREHGEKHLGTHD